MKKSKKPTISVSFKEVGWDKRSFTRTITSLTFKQMEKAMRSGALVMSRNISFDLSEDGKSGTIFAGFHTIGTFEISTAQA